MNKNINEIIQNPLSSSLISKYFNGKPNIVMMEQISRMTSLNELFRHHDHAVIFVATNSRTDGHWQLIYKSGGSLHFFDSYGMRPTELIARIRRKLGHSWEQNDNLDKLIFNSPYRYKSYFNDVKYQMDNKNQQTCGRYIAMVFILLHIYKTRNMNFDGTMFYNIMNALKKQYGVSYDAIVSNFIDKIDFSSF